MKTAALKPQNGKSKTAIRCPNGVDCEVAQSAADTLSLIDARFQRVEESLTRLHDEALSFRRAVLESHEEVLKALGCRRGEA